MTIQTKQQTACMRERRPDFAFESTDDWWTVEEVQHLRATAATFRRRFRGVRACDVLEFTIVVGFYVPLRPRELRSLRRDQLSSQGRIGRSGTASGFRVTVPAWVIDQMDRRYPSTVEHVCAWQGGREGFYYNWRQLLTRSGLPTKPREGLRKLHATAVVYREVVQSGIDPLAVDFTADCEGGAR